MVEYDCDIPNARSHASGGMQCNMLYVDDTAFCGRKRLAARGVYDGTACHLRQIASFQKSTSNTNMQEKRGIEHEQKIVYLLELRQSRQCSELM